MQNFELCVLLLLKCVFG